MHRFALLDRSKVGLGSSVLAPDLPRQRALCTGVEMIGESLSLLHAAIGEGTVLVPTRPALTRVGVSVAHDVDRDRPHRLVASASPPSPWWPGT